MSSIFRSARNLFSGMFRTKKEATIKTNLNKATGPVSTAPKKSRAKTSIPERRGSGVPMTKLKARIADQATQGEVVRKKPLRYTKRRSLAKK